MLYPAVTELARGTAHPQSQRLQTGLVARSPAPLRLARRSEGAGLVRRSRETPGPARWHGQQAA